MVGLSLREQERLGYQSRPGRRRVRAGADHRDDLVDGTKRPDQTLQDVQSGLRRGQPEP